MATEQHARSHFFAQFLRPRFIGEGEIEGDDSGLVILARQWSGKQDVHIRGFCSQSKTNGDSMSVNHLSKNDKTSASIIQRDRFTQMLSKQRWKRSILLTPPFLSGLVSGSALRILSTATGNQRHWPELPGDSRARNTALDAKLLWSKDPPNTRRGFYFQSAAFREEASHLHSSSITFSSSWKSSYSSHLCARPTLRGGQVCLYNTSSLVEALSAAAFFLPILPPYLSS